MNDSTFPLDTDAMLATLVHIFASEGATVEVALLADAEAVIEADWQDRGYSEEWTFLIHLQVPVHLYSQVADDLKGYEKRILERAQPMLKPYPGHYLQGVTIGPLVIAEPDWRDKARNWVKG